MKIFHGNTLFPCTSDLKILLDGRLSFLKSCAAFFISFQLGRSINLWSELPAPPDLSFHMYYYGNLREKTAKNICKLILN